MTRTVDRETFYADVVVTAVEGGINYWAQTTGYRWYFPDLNGGTLKPAPGGGGNAVADVHEMGDEEEAVATYRLTPDTIAKAFSILAGVKSSVPKHLSEAYCKRLLAEYRDPESADLDAADADILVQLGLFGEVRYG